MATSTDPQRYVLVVGDASSEVASLDGVSVIQKLDHVVLVETSLSTARVLRDAARPHVHVYSSKKAARAALDLFKR
ncbi:MAG TPA: hypothetical protein VLA90_05590 [Actinomycetota bacterium]|nr:hypothetical protein [Actinomycetota bacterium]